MRLIVFCSLWAFSYAYTDMIDSFDTEGMTKNIDLLRSHINCYIDKGPCNDTTERYKKHMQEVLDDACRECNERQKHQFKLFFQSTKDMLPAEFQQMKKKYDPNGIHFENDVLKIKNY